MGLPDPVTALLEQVAHDPDAEILTTLLTEWYMEFNSKPTTVRKLVEIAQEDSPDLLDALHEFPIVERGTINRSKLGRMLKRNANRIVGNFELQKTTADGRTAWKVVQVTNTELSSLTEEQKQRLADREGIRERLDFYKYEM